MSTYFLCTKQTVDSKHVHEKWWSLVLLLVLPAILRADESPNCPNVSENQKCSCYKYEDGLFLECPSASIDVLWSTLKSVEGPIQSFSIYELDKSVEVLGPEFIPHGSCIRHLHLSQTNIKDIDDETFATLRKCLETLSIVSSKMKYIPQKAFSGLNKMISLDLEYNFITELPGYSFYGLPIIKLNMKGNQLQEISEFAFSSLEDTLSEVDLSENDLKYFPMSSIYKLRLLRSLRLAWNEISAIPLVETSDLISVVYLDLSSNNFVTIPEDCFASCPSIKILSLHFNAVEDLNKLAFYSLNNLESLDLSHNRIKNINREIFRYNNNLKHVDISHNHIHHINGIFSNLPKLIEIVLSSNNILEVPIDAFSNATSISVVYLENNSIKNLHSDSLETLENLTQLHLGFNMLSKVPQKLFRNKDKLEILNLDHNNIVHLEPDTFSDLFMLKEIRLQCNQLKFISKTLFRNTKHLQEIHLQRNNISTIEFGAFKRLKILRSINLQKNCMSNVNDILSYPSSLAHLHLNENLISNLAENTLISQTHIKTLLLSHNVLRHITQNIFKNVTSLESLYLNDNNISHIEDYSFSYMKSLKCLDVSRNKLQNISNLLLIGLKEIEELYLSTNNISNIMPKSFDMLKKLRIVDLSDNFLIVIHNYLFKQGLPLRTLNLQNCSIKTIEEDAFKGLNNLNSLLLEHNSLKSEDVMRINVPGLKTLKLSFNNLSQLQSDAFYQLPLIQGLYLDNCLINFLPQDIFANNKMMIKLNLSSNLLNYLDAKVFSENKMVSDINLDTNKLQDVPYEALQKLPQLEILYLSNNMIKTLHSDKLASLKKLKQIQLNSNEITVIYGDTSNALDEVLILDFSSNNLNVLPENMFQIFPNVQKINVSNNSLEDFVNIFAGDESEKQLISLDISYNSLNSWITYNTQQTVKAKIFELHISDTVMTTINEYTFKYFSELKHLTINRNKIDDISKSPFVNLISLQSLDLSENKLSYIQTSNFFGLIKLISLNLSRNLIIKIESFAIDLLSLKTLDLSFNEIDNIQNQDFENLFDLTDLNLCNNAIIFLADCSYEQQKKLKTLNLKHNLLEYVPSKVLSSTERQVAELYFEGNLISCDCQSRDLWIWMQDHPRVAMSMSIKCQNPYWLYDQYLLDVNMSEICELPIISDIEIHKVNRYSISVSWQVRNQTSITAFQILYYADDNAVDVKTRLLDEHAHSTDIKDLQESTQYVICIIAIHREDPPSWNNTFPILLKNETSANASKDAPSFLVQSPSSECTTYSNFEKAQIIKPSPNAYSGLSKILTRRLGLIVGCSMGVVVFILLVSVLGYMKTRKRRLMPDLDQVGSEMNYGNSIQSSENVLQMPKNYSSENILLGMTKKRISLSK